MNRIILTILMLVSLITVKAETSIESFNMVSEDYIDVFQDAQLIRPINGGTVIIPIFDESCPEELKGPFSYACKIVEEYMPPCLPIKVKVSCGRVSNSNNSISKVVSHAKENFGSPRKYKYVPMSTIKGVILAELVRGSTVTYLDSIPNLAFLMGKDDIEITYNNQILSDLYFSIESNPETKYDFVSVAIRDLLRGLGFISSYFGDIQSNELFNPGRRLNPFEYFIDDALGNYNNLTARFAKATQGELVLNFVGGKSLKLYAPEQWVNGVSLNYFIPQEDCSVSQILTYDFGKGMVARSLNDDYSSTIFRELLGWQPDYTSSSGISNPEVGGSTSLKMPYNGSISFSNTSSYGIESYCLQSNAPMPLSYDDGYEDNWELRNYIDSFHPFLFPVDNEPYEGASICVLKKDGTWDLVKCEPWATIGCTHRMSDWEFHFDADEYARTIEGYLRARVTYKSRDRLNAIKYKSLFFVIDYLPQKINLGYKLITSQEQGLSRSISSVNEEIPVRIYFSNLEGINRVVLERLRQGFRVPSKIEVYDYIKGYFDTTIDRTTTFTAVGYNENGYSRSVPITITPASSLSSDSSLSFSLVDNQILIDVNDYHPHEFDYCISPLNVLNQQQILYGKTNETIDISSLSDGIYLLKVSDEISGQISNFKFKK